MPEVTHSEIMFGKASQEISKYLTTGMHHSTNEAQERVTQIIEKCVAEEARNHTPSEFAIKLFQIASSPDYSI